MLEGIEKEMQRGRSPSQGSRTPGTGLVVKTLFIRQDFEEGN